MIKLQLFDLLKVYLFDPVRWVGGIKNILISHQLGSSVVYYSASPKGDFLFI